MKKQKVFMFVDGSLSIKVDGYEWQNGWGQFSWDEVQVEMVPHEERSGCSMVVDITRTELIDLRDFLNRVFPPSAVNVGETP